MDTTVVLDDDVFREAARQAERSGVTLAELVNQTLRWSLAQRDPAPYRISIYGGATPLHHEPADLSDADDAEDRLHYQRVIETE